MHVKTLLKHQDCLHAAKTRRLRYMRAEATPLCALGPDHDVKISRSHQQKALNSARPTLRSKRCQPLLSSLCPYISSAVRIQLRIFDHLADGAWLWMFGFEASSHYGCSSIFTFFFCLVLDIQCTRMSASRLIVASTLLCTEPRTLAQLRDPNRLKQAMRTIPVAFSYLTQS